MRRLVCASAALALLLAGTAAAGPPAFDKAEGAGTYLRAGCAILVPEGRPPACFPPFPLIERRFSFSALQRGFGVRATGIYTQQQINPDGTLSRWVGRVTCLNVLADTAVFGGIVTEGPATEFVGIPFVIWVVDNGNASDGDPPDLISPLAIFPQDDPDRPLLPAGFPNICPQPFPSLYGYFPLTSGNIVVEDESQPGVAAS